MRQRKLIQFGWISGPVDCCCSECDWSTAFYAADSSVPPEVQADFESHECRRHLFAPNQPSA